MKLPRGVSAARVIRALEHFGYQVNLQRGSHVRTEVAETRSIPLESLTELL